MMQLVIQILQNDFYELLQFSLFLTMYLLVLMNHLPLEKPPSILKIISLFGIADFIQ